MAQTLCAESYTVLLAGRPSDFLLLKYWTQPEWIVVVVFLPRYGNTNFPHRFPLDKPSLMPHKQCSRGGGELIGFRFEPVGYVAI